MDGTTKKTTDHETIRRWAEARGGQPRIVRDGDEDDVLRVDFGETTPSGGETSWEDFFQVFEDLDLEFIYQEETPDGAQSRLFKFVPREDVDE